VVMRQHNVWCMCVTLCCRIITIDLLCS